MKTHINIKLYNRLIPGSPMPPKYYKKNFKNKNTTSVELINTEAKYLFIVESPSKCAKIEHFLGNDYCCIASKGHIRTIEGLKSIDTKDTFTPNFTIINEKREHVEKMKKIIERFSKTCIFIATDDDREGEAIGWHICMEFGLPIETTKRVIFHEVTKNAIQECVKTPTILDMKIVYSQHARQVLDMLVGYKISPDLWKYLYNNKSNSLSAGRCQTPALRLIYENEKNKTLELEEKYKIHGKFFAKNIKFQLNKNISTSIDVLHFLKLSKAFSHRLSVSDFKKSTKEPPKPFNTSRLLQVASNVLHMSPKTTMEVCQKLYQGGFITYMRTESIKYSKAFLEKSSNYIENIYKNKKYIGNVEKLENKDTNNPHEAIRVTQIEINMLGNCEDTRMSTMYKLIWKNSVQSCMSAAIYNVSNIKITAPDSMYYTYNVEIPSFLGWKKLDSNGDETENENNPAALHMYLKSVESSGKDIEYNEINSELHVVNQHTHYTEAGLINKLEEMGIGRPSTFSSIVETIQERGYVKKMDIDGVIKCCEEYTLSRDTITTTHAEKVFGAEKQKLVIQPVGILTIEFLLKYYEDMFSYEYTKNMEYDLDKISSGEITDWANICRNCVNEIKRQSQPIKAISKQSYPIEEGYVFIYEKYGPAIKHTLEDGTIEYITAKTDVDLDKIKNGEYSLNELIEVNERLLGKYENQDLYVKNGRYGMYVEYGENRVTIKSIKKEFEQIEFADVVEVIENPNPKENFMLRKLNKYMDIRRGQYGPYVFYFRPDMKKPKFLNIKKCPHGFLTCSIETLVEWLCKTYKLPKI
jgi:DNA topoisomerase I